MTEINKERMALARRNAEQCIADPRVQAVLLVGSVAKGYADDASDIDMTVYTNEPYTQEEFDRVCDDARASGGDLYHGTPEDGFAIYRYVDGVKCDFGIISIDKGEEQLRELLEKTDLDLNEQILLSGFQDGVALYGEEWVNEWKAKLEEHPSQLAESLVKKSIRFYPRWVLHRMGVERGEMLFVYQTFIEATENIINLLCGLNRIYPSGKLKGVAWTIGKMAIKPDNLLSRLESLFTLAPAAAVDSLYDLIGEVLSLVEEHMPEVSTTRARTVLGMELRK